MIEKIDVNVPAEYISEVIPIKYALAGDIASALNSLGGSGGGATVSVGGSTGAAPISGFRSGATGGGFGGAGGVGGTGNQYQSGLNQPNTPFGQRGFGAQGTTGSTPNGTPTTGTSFQQRLNAIINRAAGSGSGQQDQIQVFGQAKIIADARANSLLVFATRPDMDRIKEVINKLDVLLSQVLIEAVIMDVSLGNQFQFGVSAAQNPKTLSPSLTGGRRRRL